MRNKPNNLDSLAKCSACGGGFSADRMVLLEEKEEKTTFHVTCSKCDSAAIVFLSSNQSGLVSVGMATDLDAAEVKKIFGRDAISADEVIDAHQFISSSSDMAHLLKSN